MPGMIRIKGKATKIAYRILGVPGNLRKEKPSKIKERLTFEETYKAR